MVGDLPTPGGCRGVAGRRKVRNRRTSRSGLQGPLGRPRWPIRARYSPELDRLDLSEFTVSTAYGTLDASGKLEEATGSTAGSTSRGSSPPTSRPSTPCWSARSSRGQGRGGLECLPGLGDARRVVRGLEVASTPISASTSSGADIYGMKFGPSRSFSGPRGASSASTRSARRSTRGTSGSSPRSTSTATRRPGPPAGQELAIREARINDEVSKRVLTYVAPVLDQATRASGLVSVDLDHAEFPIGPGRGRQAKVEGRSSSRTSSSAPVPWPPRSWGPSAGAT